MVDEKHFKLTISVAHCIGGSFCENYTFTTKLTFLQFTWNLFLFYTNWAIDINWNEKQKKTIINALGAEVYNIR